MGQEETYPDTHLEINRCQTVCQTCVQGNVQPMAYPLAAPTQARWLRGLAGLTHKEVATRGRDVACLTLVVDLPSDDPHIGDALALSPLGKSDMPG